MDVDLGTSSPEQIINGGDEDGEEQCDEEFYEKIEAPKFVDFTAPERRRPDEDCYWFCMRVGCDRKHEEEIDPEEIYKNFVLRVMAARSPNVRFGRALQRKALSTNLKCPQTAPPKSSRPRASRLEMRSSISLKKSLTKLPNVKPRRLDFGAKALTTPRNRTRVSNPHPFQSVRKLKELDLGLPKSKVVAKALVFPSPKKAVRLKASLELKAPLRKICSEMKKLEITSQRKQPLPLDAASKKKLAAREVKSRFFDSLHCKGQEAKPSGHVKKKEHEQCESGHEHDCSDMEIDEKSRKGSMDVCEKSLANSKTLDPVSENSAEAISNDDSGDNGNSKNKRKFDETMKSSSEEGKKIQEDRDGDYQNQENASASDVKQNHDDKENASAPDANREHDHTKSKVLGKQKSSKCTQKVIQVLGKKTKDTTNSAASGAQVVKYTKPKPTNPKPFRLRTDERYILKEANMEKKLHLQPLKEITPVTRIIPRRKQMDEPEKRTRKAQDQPRKIIDSQTDKAKDKEVKGLANRTKTPLMKQPARPQGFSTLKVAHSETSQTTLKPKKATMKPGEKGIVSAAKASSSTTRRSLARGRRRPSFYRIHVHKSSTKEIS